MEVLHISCNMCTRDLPDMYALSPQAYISGKSLVPMLKLIHILPGSTITNEQNAVKLMVAARATMWEEN